MKNITLKGKDNKPFNVVIWNEVKSPKAVLQISHGMAEYIARYAPVATLFNEAGFIVIGDDHRGHGETCGAEHRGVTTGDSFFDTIDDISVVTDYAIAEFGLPVVLLGHSYGSFLSQGYIQKYGDKIKGVFLSGSAYMHSGLVKMGGIISKCQNALCNSAKPAKLIEKLSFGSYDKPFPADEQPFAWLSRDKSVVEAYRNDPDCGFTMSINFQASFLNGVYKLYSDEGLNNIPKDLPIFIGSGDRDPVGGDGKLVTALYEMYKALGFDVEMKLYPEARHEILNETNRAEVIADVVKFVKKCIK